MGHNILELDASKPCLGNTHNFLFRVFPDMRATRMRPFAGARLGGEKSGKHDSKPSPEISTSKQGGFQMQARGQFDTRSNDGRDRRALMRAEPGRPARLRIRALPPAGRNPPGRRRAPGPAAAGAGADPGEQRGAGILPARFSHLGHRPGAGIHHGQQQRRLHAEKCRNRHGRPLTANTRRCSPSASIRTTARIRAPAWAPSRTRPRCGETVSTRSPPAASLLRPTRRISW